MFHYSRPRTFRRNYASTRHNHLPGSPLAETSAVRTLDSSAMVDSNVNPGIHPLNVPDHHEPRTAVVLGLPRGGTSMVAGVLHHLGVDMGDDFNTATFEDRRLSGAVEKGSIDAVRRIVNERNNRSNIWGWKRPSARKHLDIVQAEFRNPYYIMVFRDMLAIATRKHLSIRSDVIKAMRSNVRAQRQLIDIAASLDAPLLLLSYEKCLNHPPAAAAAIAEFVGVPVTNDATGFIQADAPEYVERTRPR